LVRALNKAGIQTVASSAIAETQEWGVLLLLYAVNETFALAHTIMHMRTVASVE